MLITDDDRDFRETLRGVFEPRGFRTLLAADGEEALQILRGQAVHLILLDMHMPKLSGLETIRRASELQPVPPWILLSARLDDAIIEQARRINVSSVLSKPVSFTDITGAVSRVMRQTYGWPEEGGWETAPSADLSAAFSRQPPGWTNRRSRSEGPE
jgi:CheY-like chemotaxis protein